MSVNSVTGGQPYVGKMVWSGVKHEAMVYGGIGAATGMLVGASKGGAAGAAGGLLAGAAIGAATGALGGAIDGLLGSAGVGIAQPESERGFKLAGAAGTSIGGAVLGGISGARGGAAGVMVGMLTGGAVGFGFGYWNSSATVKQFA